jgi:hypothetical protein
MRKNKTIIILAILILARVIIFIFDNYKEKNITSSKLQTELTAQDPFQEKIAPTELTNATKLGPKTEICNNLKLKYSNEAEIKKNAATDSRYINIHKKIDGIVYRLRFFYKDSSENEIPTYILYKEDQNEEEHLIEKSSYKKGLKYKKTEKALGEIIYKEEGLIITGDHEIFLLFENSKLKMLQGNVLDQTKDKFYECRY